MPPTTGLQWIQSAFRISGHFLKMNNFIPHCFTNWCTVPVTGADWHVMRKSRTIISDLRITARKSYVPRWELPIYAGSLIWNRQPLKTTQPILKAGSERLKMIQRCWFWQLHRHKRPWTIYWNIRLTGNPDKLKYSFREVRLGLFFC